MLFVKGIKRFDMRASVPQNNYLAFAASALSVGCAVALLRWPCGWLGQRHGTAVKK